MGAANAQTLKRMYAPMAPDYEEIWAPLLRPFGLRLLEMLPLERARRVLELGCGVGRLLPDIAARAAPGAAVIGCDLVEDMLTRAPAAFPRAVVDGTQLPFADRSFDAVISAFCIFHFPDPPGALRRVRRTVSPAGSIALAVWGTGESLPAMEAWDGALDRLGVPPDPAGGVGDGRRSVDSAEKMQMALRGAGFEDVRTESAEWRVQWTLDGFLAWRLRMGPSRRRLGQLDPSRRAVVIEAARARAAELGVAGLLHLDEVVLASGRTPG
jgi:SAM-dependent methyltransferase